MIMDVECKFCDGLGRIHTRNGDPWDKGQDCPQCQGTGSVEVECDQSDED